MSDFIRVNLITKIKDQVKIQHEILDFEGFLFLEREITHGKKIINRLNRWSLYSKEELMPLNWMQIPGGSLLEIYSQLKGNNFYIYKLSGGKSYKIKPKKI